MLAALLSGIDEFVNISPQQCKLYCDYGYLETVSKEGSTDRTNGCRKGNCIDIGSTEYCVATHHGCRPGWNVLVLFCWDTSLFTPTNVCSVYPSSVLAKTDRTGIFSKYC